MDMAHLPQAAAEPMASARQQHDAAGQLARQLAGQGIVMGGADIGRWHPGEGGSLHCEIFAADDEAGGAGLALSFAALALAAQEVCRHGSAGADKSFLWVQDKEAMARSGRPYRPGLPEPLRHRLIHVAARSARDALFAIEEGLRCRDLACVVGEIAGNPRALDFVASRRFSLAAQRHGTPLVLVRLGARVDLGAARMRWRVRSAPSPAPLWNNAAPGRATWHGELFRARGHAPGEWLLRCDLYEGEGGRNRSILMAEPVRAAEARSADLVAAPPAKANPVGPGVHRPGDAAALVHSGRA